MIYSRSFGFMLSILALCCVLGAAAAEPDWPQWQGPDRTNLSKETGLLKQWAPQGPPKLWSISGLGAGYGTVSIKGDRIFVQGTQNNESVVFCLNRSNGKIVWTKALGPTLNHDRGSGPRGTPTLEANRVYVLSENGDLACLKAEDGSVIWSRNILVDFKGRNPRWLISESPLIDGNRLIVTPGGEGGQEGKRAGIVALDKMTGKTIWTSADLGDPAGYSSCIAVDVGGVRTIIGLTSLAGVGVRASDGKLMWSYPSVANRTANITTPIFHQNKVFYTSAYGTGCALLGLKTEGGEVKAQEIYFSKEMQNHHGGVVLVGGHLYGFSNAILTCMEFETGKAMWKDRSVGKGSLTFADGHLYLFSENNVVGLAEATPEGYKEKGRFTIEDQGRPSWAHPVVCEGKLYIRNQGVLACYDVRDSSASN
jgi:outer membrane protein assembly factor BamB